MIGFCNPCERIDEARASIESSDNTALYGYASEPSCASKPLFCKVEPEVLSLCCLKELLLQIFAMY